jgi:cell division protein ZapA (FtsZ GTPase activity inhibitor)
MSKNKKSSKKVKVKVENSNPEILAKLASIVDNTKKEPKKINILEIVSLLIATISLVISIIALNTSNEFSKRGNELTEIGNEITKVGNHLSQQSFETEQKQLPLNYSLDKIEPIPKISSGENTFTLSPVYGLTFTRNTGGLANSLFLAEVKEDNSVFITKATEIGIDRNLDVAIPDNKNESISRQRIAWKNTKDTFSLTVFDSRMAILIQNGIYAKSIHFLIVQGENHNYEIITLISKGTTTKDGLEDVHIAYYNLEIYDSYLFNKKITDKTLLSDGTENELKSLLPIVQNQYKIILDFIRETNL